MNVLLLDTNIVSFATKQDTRIQRYAATIQGNQQAISFMTVAELYQWAFVHNWGTRRTRALEASFANYLYLPLEREMCRIWAEARAEFAQVGRTLSPTDAWIAATAIYYDLPLVTHNPKDFTHISNLEVITFA